MLIKILGALDFIGGLLLLAVSGFKLPTPILIFFGVAFLIKASLGMMKDFASWIDGTAGVFYLILIFFPIHWVLCVIVGILVLQKGIFSFL